MPGKIDLAGLLSLQTPEQTYKQEYELYLQQEKTALQPTPITDSLCSRCCFGFTFSCSKGPYHNAPELEIYCTAPWFRDARRVGQVTNCNGFTYGQFDFSVWGIEKAIPGRDEPTLQEILPLGHPEKTENTLDKAENTLDQEGSLLEEDDLDEELALLESETGDIEKAFTEEKPLAPEDDPTALPKAEPEINEAEEAEESEPQKEDD